jgi:hypothetical protein
VNVNSKPSAFDLVLVTDFENKDALNKYRSHPEHQRVIELLAGINEDIAVVDYYI